MYFFYAHSFMGFDKMRVSVITAVMTQNIFTTPIFLLACPQPFAVDYSGRPMSECARKESGTGWLLVPVLFMFLWSFWSVYMCVYTCVYMCVYRCTCMYVCFQCLCVCVWANELMSLIRVTYMSVNEWLFVGAWATALKNLSQQPFAAL